MKHLKRFLVGLAMYAIMSVIVIPIIMLATYIAEKSDALEYLMYITGGVGVLGIVYLTGAEILKD